MFDHSQKSLARIIDQRAPVLLPKVSWLLVFSGLLIRFLVVAWITDKAHY